VSVYKRPNSETYSYDFQLRGRRFSGNTEARSKKDASAVERQLKAKVKADFEELTRTGNGPLLLRHAAGRYWEEVGKYHRDLAGTWNALDLLTKHFGSDKRLDEITDADVAGLVAWRRGHTVKGRGKKALAPATVNRSVVEPLRKLFIRARVVWRYQFPREPLWRTHRLKEPVERVRELHASEAEALYAALRPDFEPWFSFASATGLRLAETLISWDCVNWEARSIVTKGKGGRPVSTPITDAVATILWPLKGHHPEAVFTYLCRRPKTGHLKGERLPLTYAGAKSEWQALRKRAGIKGFRFHDVRHDFATKLLRKTGNLKLVSRALNHSDVKTTMRYAHIMDGEVADALQDLSLSRQKSHVKSHAADSETVQISEINKKVS
jgi:integrase